MSKYDIAAYIWPAYTGDDLRARIFWREGIGEWQTVKNVEANSIDYKKQWYDGWQGRKPLWGYVNEARPEIMEMEIDCATRYGVNVFIYDWYWYDNRPFLENCLNDGFLGARNNGKMKFYLMWANHDVRHVWNIDESDDTDLTNDVIWRGSASRTVFVGLVTRWIDKYFTHPSYYKIDGKPVFMIYDIANLLNGFGGIKETRDALDYFRGRAKAAGFPDLYFQLVLYKGYPYRFEGEDGERLDTKGLTDALNIDSVTNYQWCAVTGPTDYADLLDGNAAEYSRLDSLGLTYFPNASVGWDNNPRYRKYRTDVVYNNTPALFERALREAKDYVDTHDLPAKLITVNSWNEWCETSYLLPDTLNGYGYLEAIKRVFLDGE